MIALGVVLVVAGAALFVLTSRSELRGMPLQYVGPAAMMTIGILILLMALMYQASAGEALPLVPDPRLTPGVVASADEAEVCGKVDGRSYSQRHRQTSAAMKAEVYQRYGIEKRGRDFEIDHRLELSLGGADVIENLWPQQGWMHPSYHDKDRLEARAWRMVCIEHSMTLAAAQAIFLAPDWTAGYRRVFGSDPR